MKQVLGILLLTVMGYASVANAEPVFEYTGASKLNWDWLDYHGDLVAEVREEMTTPPGYGPQVLQLEGGNLLGLAHTPARASGTIIALYRELAPIQYDADGIIVFAAQYGEDVSVEHNTKTIRAHRWMEMDNDQGLHFRAVDENHAETVLAEAPGGVGLITDDWNESGWIWQKLSFTPTHAKAKFWPAHLPEPMEWHLETQLPEVSEGRVGVRANSGRLQLAYFAVADENLSSVPPQAWLLAQGPTAESPNHTRLALFSNRAEPFEDTLRITVTAGERVLAETTHRVILPAGSATRYAYLGVEEPEGDGLWVPLPSDAPAGEWTIDIRNADDSFALRQSVQVAPVAEAQQRLAKLAETIAAGQIKLDQAPIHQGYRKQLQAALDAARAHHAMAEARLALGEVDAALRAIDYGIDAVKEFETFRANPDPDAWEVLRVSSKPASLAERNPARFIYPTEYGLRFDAHHLHRSIVMGETFRDHLNVEVLGDAVGHDLVFEIQLLRPITGHVVASLLAAPEIPTTAWRGGQRYEMAFEVLLPTPDATPRPPTPIITDDWHQWIVTVIDKSSGAALYVDQYRPFGPPQPKSWLARYPGPAVFLAPCYVSAEPLRAHLNSNMGGYELLLGIAGQTPTPLNAVFSMNPDAPAAMTVDQVPLTDWVARLTGSWPAVQNSGRSPVMAEIRSGHRSLTRALAPVTHEEPLFAATVTAPVAMGEALAMASTVQIKDIDSARVGAVKVYHGDRLVGEGTGAVIACEPVFGYYDIIAEIDGNPYHQRVIGTVVDTLDDQLRVNGEPFLIKGLNVHGLDGASPERSRAMMRVFRERGFNMLRGDFPPYWQMELALEENLGWTVLAPFSIVHTSDLAADRFEGPAYSAAREQTRHFIERYRDAAAVLMWNSANEIEGDISDFLVAVEPMYRHFDPHQRPIHYANLYAQDRFDGQDGVGVNYYFGSGETPASRHAMIERNIDEARQRRMPLFYTEFNGFLGAIHYTGVDALENLYTWGVERGMAGGFYYFRFDSERHPGVIDGHYNTYPLLNEALHKAFDDAVIRLVVHEDRAVLIVKNRRNFTLRKLELEARMGHEVYPAEVPDLAPQAQTEVTLPWSPGGRVPLVVAGELRFTTHHAFHERVPFTSVSDN